MPAYERTLLVADFTDVDVVFGAADTWQRIGEFVNDDPNSVVYLGGKHGYFYAIMYDDTTDAVEETGEHRFVIADPNEVVRKVVFRCRSELASADAIDKTEKLKLDLRKPGAKYKSKIIWEYQTDAADTIDVSACTMYLDVTQVIA